MAGALAPPPWTLAESGIRERRSGLALPPGPALYLRPGRAWGVVVPLAGPELKSEDCEGAKGAVPQGGRGWIGPPPGCCSVTSDGGGGPETPPIFPGEREWP
ncbi:hypothetical protein NDU88_003234 [Pleurodeles waltl]|uniref:Uncharacterized protein n=1 Tax=Pleurodeles waltl TaxID=8319 RepID=A0AAV7QF49_PLEWA|nr:hypothetical protein NDU88_003234 [Pleurodeles waltl]